MTDILMKAPRKWLNDHASISGLSSRLTSVKVLTQEGPQQFKVLYETWWSTDDQAKLSWG